MTDDDTARRLFSEWAERCPSGSDEDFKMLCSAHSAFAEELRRMHEERRASQTVDDSQSDSPSRAGSPIRTFLEELKVRDPPSVRYRSQGAVGMGGMAAVLRVFDTQLQRHLAMKVMLGDAEVRLARFLEEAQITGQLDHPGIVPVHELGVDEKGKVFFTMKLVKGVTLGEIFKKVETGEDGWSVTRALTVLLRVCEAMAFAHEKKVIHRDLKPSNIMVGRHGEVYVMDWGLARVLDRKDTADVRVRTEGIETTHCVVRGDRHALAAEGHDTPESPLVTIDGDAIGTPSYMPPEQAEGKLDLIGPRSDVYAVGSMLYHLLAGAAPYTEPGKGARATEILQGVLHGPPPPLEHRARKAPAELLAICEKAMARRIDDRYATMNDLAEDLRAFLEHRVVKAYGAGALAELRKWVRRNRGLAVALTLAVFAIVAGLVGVLWQEGKRKADAEARKAEFDQLAGVVHLESALAREAELCPPWPDRIESMDNWLELDAARLASLRPRVESTAAELDRRVTSKLAGESERFLHATLSDLARKLADFDSRVRPDMVTRLAWAQRVEELTLHHPKARATWDQARAALRSADGRVASALYRDASGSGIDLEPQIGLVPIGMNPKTRLWEFYELRSAWDPVGGRDPADLEIPTHAIDGTIAIGGESGIVFVLIPGGSFLMGSQKLDPAAPNYDPEGWADESPPHRVTVAPFFLARHEVTKGQWKRLAGLRGGGEPSGFEIGKSYDGDLAIGYAHPVEQVGLEECTELLRRNGLLLPTEVEWEYAARAGTSTTWWTGTEASSLKGNGNLLDLHAAASNSEWDDVPEGDFDDGFVHIAPAGSFAPSPWGIHDVHGNVWEWCREFHGKYTMIAAGQPTPAAEDGRPDDRLIRGGAFNHPASMARSAYREWDDPTNRNAIGVRAARALK